MVPKRKQRSFHSASSSSSSLCPTKRRVAADASAGMLGACAFAVSFLHPDRVARCIFPLLLLFLHEALVLSKHGTREEWCLDG